MRRVVLRTAAVRPLVAGRAFMSSGPFIGPGHPLYNIPTTGSKPDTPVPEGPPLPAFLAPKMDTNWGKFKAAFHNFPIFVISAGLCVVAFTVPGLAVLLFHPSDVDTVVTDMTYDELKAIIQYVEETTGPLD